MADMSTSGLKALGLRVHTYRKLKGMTQEELADKVGCNKRTIQRVEQGIQSSTISMLDDIAKALDVPLPELVDLDAPIPFSRLQGPYLRHKSQLVA